MTKKSETQERIKKEYRPSSFGWMILISFLCLKKIIIRETSILETAILSAGVYGAGELLWFILKKPRQKLIAWLENKN